MKGEPRISEAFLPSLRDLLVIRPPVPGLKALSLPTNSPRSNNLRFLTFWKSRRDDLSIEHPRVPNFFLFIFQRRGFRSLDLQIVGPAPLKNKKKKVLVGWSVVYRQVIPTGFERTTLRPRCHGFSSRIGERNVGNDEGLKSLGHFPKSLRLHRK